MKVSHGLSVLYWIRKNAGSEDKSPLYCRITINGQRSNYAMGIEVKEKDFNKATGFLKSRTEDAAIINESLIENTSKVRKIFNDLKEKNEHVTPPMICNVLHGKIEKQKTLKEAYEFHNKLLLEKVHVGIMANGTYKKYKVSFNKLKAFIKHTYHLSDMPLVDIKKSFAADFEHYLVTVDKIGSNTAMKYIRNTKKVMWFCVQKDWLFVNPLQGFKCTYNAPQREVLIEDELHALATTPIKSKRLNEARDCYLAMCYTGYAYKDASQLSNDNIQTPTGAGLPTCCLQVTYSFLYNSDNTNKPFSLPLKSIACYISNPLLLTKPALTGFA
jgi:hypothetical protein